MKQRSLPWLVRILGRSGEDPGDLRTIGGSLTRSGGHRRRILVVRQDNRLGNLILLIPFLRALRSAVPNAEIAILSGEAYAELIDSFPWVDRWIVQEKRQHIRHPWLFPGWLRGVRSGSWDAAFEMSNHNTHSFYNCVLAVASGARLRIGFDEPRNANALTHPVPPPDHRVPFALAPLEMLRACGLPVKQAPPALRPQSPPSPQLTSFRQEELGDEPYALVHVGGRGGKSWPLESWIRLLPRLREVARSRIVLIGGPDELDQMRTLRAPNESGRAALGAPDLLAPRARFQRASSSASSASSASAAPVVVSPLLGLSDLAHLIQGGSFYLGCDTGVMHLAAAVGTPTVALFFRSNPLQYGPLGKAHRTVLLADPYGAGDGDWDVPFPQVERSRLILAPFQAADSARGVPAVGPPAEDAILRAVEGLEWEAGTEAVPLRPDSPRTVPS